jgi:toxin FitB
VRFLADGNVLSEPTRQSPSPQVVKWLTRNETELAVNPIVLGELEYGIRSLPAGRRRTRLADWFAQGAALLHVFEIDRETGRIWATLLANLRRKGRAMPVKDSLIAATALQHGLTVATRNTSDYRHAGVALTNPFAD